MGHKQVISFAYDSGPQITIALCLLAIPSMFSRLFYKRYDCWR
jgi:hypothetical protein